MKGIMIFVAGMICGLMLSVGMLMHSGHMNIGTEQVVHTYTYETTNFTGLEFR